MRTSEPMTMQEFMLLNDGQWYEWKGGVVPVNHMMMVDVEFEGGGFDYDFAGDFVWDHNYGSGNIIAYRPHKIPKTDLH